MPHPLEELFGAIGRQQQKAPLDVLPIPKEHILPVLTLLQKTHEHQHPNQRLGKTAALVELWRYVHKAMPFTRTKEIALDTTNPMVPVINIVGEYKPPVVGKRRVAAIHIVPPEHHYKLFELLDLDSGGPLHQYNLWAFIGDIVPEIAADPHGSYEVDTHATDDVMIVKTLPKVENEEDG